MSDAYSLIFVLFMLIGFLGCFSTTVFVSETPVYECHCFFSLLFSSQGIHRQVTSQMFSQRSSWSFHQILLLALPSQAGSCFWDNMSTFLLFSPGIFYKCKNIIKICFFFIFSWMSRAESNLGSTSDPFLLLSICSCSLQLLWVKFLQPRSIAIQLGWSSWHPAEHWDHFVICVPGVLL